MDDAQIRILRNNLQEIVDGFDSHMLDGEDAVDHLKDEIRRIDAILPPPRK